MKKKKSEKQIALYQVPIQDNINRTLKFFWKALHEIEQRKLDVQTMKSKESLTKILDENHREKLFLDYFELEKKLGGKGASSKVAKQIVSDLKSA